MSHLKKDLPWVLIVSILILLAGTLPTWTGYRAETEDLRFRGLHFDAQDYTVHLSMMQAGRHGEWAYQFRFTTEPHKPAYLRMFYIVLGHLSRWMGLASKPTFELARWTLGFFALLALYTLMGKIFRNRFWTRTAFLLAALGSGMGWLQLIFGWTSTIITPIDFWLIDDYIFFSLSVFPHFAFVTLAMCLVLALWLDYLEKPRAIAIFWIGLLSILVQFTNPIAFATVDAALTGATLFSWWKTKTIRRSDILALGIIAIVQLPLLTYNFIVLSRDPLWSQFTAQNKTLSPPFDYYLWGFGMFWIPAFYGAVLAFREKSPALGGAVLWVIFGFALAYLPVEIQRRFLQNITIPLTILAASGMRKFFETESGRSPLWMRWQGSLIALFVFLTSLSSIQLSLGRSLYLQTNPDELYYPASVDQAVAWLREHAQYNDFVLASEETSQVIAQETGLRAYLGHEMETLDYENKQKQVREFFEGTMPQLASPPIRWVIYGPIEREFNPNFIPPQNLQLVYETQELQIYEVK